MFKLKNIGSKVMIGAGVILTGIAIVVLINLAKLPGCWLDWRNSNMDWQVSMGVCQVKHPQMGWIPASKIRGSD